MIASTTRPVTADRTVLWIVMAATAVLDAGNGVVFGLIAEIQKARGLETYELGYVSGALFAASLVGLLGLAHLADRGHARAMLAGALGLGAVALAWFAVAEALWELIAARVLSGLAVSLFVSAGRAVVSRLDPSRAGTNLGRLASAEIGGFVAGPALGALLFRVGGLALPFWVLSALSVVALLALLLLAPDLPNSAEPEDMGRWRRTGIDMLADRDVLAAALLALAIFLPVGAYDALWSKYLTDLGAGTTFVGLSLTVYAAPIVVLAGAGGRLADRIGPMRAAKWSMFVIIPVIVAYGLIDSYWLVAATAIVEALAQAVATPASQAAMTRACPPERIGAGHGLSGAVGLSGAGLLASGAPAIYDSYGPGWLFAGVAVASGLIAAVAFTIDQSDFAG